MKVSLNWLREYVDCPIGAAALADRLTMAGLEVEPVTQISPPVGGIVAGRILRVERHPNADRLSLCVVTDGAREYRIVCGAKNMKAGDCAPLAKPGVILPGGLRIGEAAIRGIVSEGMLCSERELELGEEAEGIMILPPETVPGAGLAAALGLDDSILDVNVPPNRPDCLGVIGVAREAAALLKTPLRPPRFRLMEAGGPAARIIRVTVEEGGLCPRYCVRAITGVAAVRSPFWMRYRLGAAGVRSINAVVDATNYVLMEYGQPLHAFDLGALRGGAIVVRTARRGERITTIDG